MVVGGAANSTATISLNGAAALERNEAIKFVVMRLGDDTHTDGTLFSNPRLKRHAERFTRERAGWRPMLKLSR